jgi:hypothetical protein
MAFSGSLEKMTIFAYSDVNFTDQVGKISVYLNPTTYTHNFKICYNNRQAQGSNGGSPEFNRIPSETVKFELVFDGTGVVSGPLPGVPSTAADGVKDQVDAFKKLVFNYAGNMHSPKYLKLSWATLLFKCRLSALDINYTLFKPDGTPLRARANATFLGFNDEKELARLANNSSPDLSHVVTVKGGDTLPLLCYSIYGSSAYYLEVARRNGLTEFRNLVPGTQLMFPPLQDAAT